MHVKIEIEIYDQAVGGICEFESIERNIAGAWILNGDTVVDDNVGQQILARIYYELPCCNIPPTLEPGERWCPWED